MQPLDNLSDEHDTARLLGGRWARAHASSAQLHEFAHALREIQLTGFEGARSIDRLLTIVHPRVQGDWRRQAQLWQQVTGGTFRLPRPELVHAFGKGVAATLQPRIALRELDETRSDAMAL